MFLFVLAYCFLASGFPRPPPPSFFFLSFFLLAFFLFSLSFFLSFFLLSFFLSFFLSFLFLSFVLSFFLFLVSSLVLCVQLDLLISGMKYEPWKFEDLADAIKTDHGYTATSDPVLHLYNVMSTFDRKHQRMFLSFVTGSPTLPGACDNR